MRFQVGGTSSGGPLPWVVQPGRQTDAMLHLFFGTIIGSATGGGAFAPAPPTIRGSNPGTWVFVLGEPRRRWAGGPSAANAIGSAFSRAHCPSMAPRINAELVTGAPTTTGRNTSTSTEVAQENALAGPDHTFPAVELQHHPAHPGWAVGAHTRTRSRRPCPRGFVVLRVDGGANASQSRFVGRPRRSRCRVRTFATGGWASQSGTGSVGGGLRM